MAIESQAVPSHTMDPRFSHLEYSWAEFETEEDLAQEQLYEHAFKSAERCESPSPIRNPESPLDDRDFERFERKTARLASISEESSSHSSIPPTPRIKPIASPDNDDFDHEASHTSTDQPPPVTKFTSSSPERILAAFGWLLDSAGAFEDAIEDRQSSVEDDMIDRQVSFERKVMDALGKLTSRVDMLIDERLPQGSLGQLTKAETPTDGVRDHPRIASELHTNDQPATTFSDSQRARSQISQTRSPLAEKYIQDWHAGGLLLIENIPQHTLLREIYALFHIHGRITYLELHGADKSKPHLPTRYAYIHYFKSSQALQACRALHHYQFHGNTLMVFPLSTDVVRGYPGKSYTGPALEILNFNGGSNYASPEADFRQPAEDLLQMDDEQDIPMPVLRPTVGTAAHALKPQLTGTTAAASATYSLKPQLTGKTAAVSWRRPDVPFAGKGMQERADEDEGGSDADEAVVFSGKKKWSRVSTFATISECDFESEPEDEDGGVYLASEDEEDEEESNVDLAYMESDDEEDFRFYAPAELLEFL